MGAFIVYKYTAKHNGLVYIGITSKSLEERWRNGYKGNPRLYNTIKKYGEEGFIREILYENLSKEEACSKEIEMIALYDATNPQKGYNISLGGTAPMWNRRHSKTTKKFFSQTRKGKNNSFYGKKHTRESLPKNIPVICLNTLEKFPSLTLAAEEKTNQGCTGCTEKNLSRAFYGQLTAGKTPNNEPLFWSKYDNSQDDNYYQELFIKLTMQREKHLEQIYAKAKGDYHKPRKEVVNLLTGERYKSAKDAQTKTGIYYSDIAQSCRGAKKSAGGNIFVYLEDFKLMSKKDKISCLIDRWTLAGNEPIVCLNNGTLYKTVTEAAKFANLKCGDSIADCANKLCEYSGIHERTGQFLRWRYFKDYVNMSAEEIQNVLNQPVSNHTPLYCITTDKHFRDASAAAKYYDLHISGLHKCCRGEYKTCGTYMGQRLGWKYDTQYRWGTYCGEESLNSIYDTEGLRLDSLFVDEEMEEEE